MMSRRRAPLVLIAVCTTLAGVVLLGQVLRPGQGPRPGTGTVTVAGDQSRPPVSVARPGGVGARGTAAGGAAVATPAVARVAPGRTVLLTDLPARPGDLGAVARGLLDEHRGELGLDGMPGELVFEREIDSLAGRHVRFVQAVQGVPVFGSRVSAHVARDGRPLLLRADVFPLHGIRDEAAAVTPLVAAGEAVADAVALLVDDDPDDPGGAAGEPLARIVAAPELTILPRGRAGVLAWLVGVRTAEETLRVFVDATAGGVVRADDARVAADGRGRVFRPNPVHATGNGALRDLGDKDQAALTNALELVTLPRLDGSGALVGEWVDLCASPLPSFRPDLDWSDVTRADDAFEQVMAYHHVDRVQARLQSLGVANVNAEAQSVNAHAAEHDQSIYDIFDDRLEFGDGGVDDAEDGDVIVHEYGHAIQFDQVGTFGLTGEGGAMGEGFGDFLAVLFHESARPAWDPLFGSWDATAIVDRDPPYLRRVDRDKVFPVDFEDQVHADGEIWSRFLMDVRNLIGADDALRVVVESHFFLTPNARFRHGCDALLVANIAVREGRDDVSLRGLMDARGLPYTVPLAPLPDEEGFETDDPATAVTLAPGTYPRLLLADDDYVKVVAPPFRRVLLRVEHDPAAFALDVEARDAAGRLAASSAEPGGVAEVTLGAGSEAFTYTVRIFNPLDGTPGAYDLAVNVVDLEALGPKQTVVRTLRPGETWAFRVAVSPNKVAAGARLRVATRKLRRGAKTDLQVFSPVGAEIVDVVSAQRKKGGKAVVDGLTPGDWLGVVRPREGHEGRARLKIKLR